MPYSIDLSSISIFYYKTKLKSSDLLPSRMLLKENIDERFKYFENMGIKNIRELQQTLKKKSKFSELAKVSFFNEEYLKILLREINSIHPKPNKFKEFTGILPNTVLKLEKMGIKDTSKLYDRVKTPVSRKELANFAGISDPEVLELTKLTDLSRIKWVGVSFARMLYDVGIDTVEKAANSDYVELHKQINQIIKERDTYKIQIGLNDIKLFVNAAKEVPLEIEY
jgi:DNA-directed RNA polymerase specialized sigma subunit